MHAGSSADMMYTECLIVYTNACASWRPGAPPGTVSAWGVRYNIHLGQAQLHGARVAAIGLADKHKLRIRQVLEKLTGGEVIRFSSAGQEYRSVLR